MGAAAATLLSYLLILIFRAAHSHRLLPFRWSVWRFIAAMGGAAGRVLLIGDGAVCGGGRLLRRCPPVVLPPDGQGLKSGVLEVVRTKRRDKLRAKTRSGAEALRLPGWSRGNGAWPAAFGSRGEAGQKSSFEGYRALPGIFSYLCTAIGIRRTGKNSRKVQISGEKVS